MREKALGKALVCLLLVLAAVTSFLLVSDWATSAESNRSVLKLTAASTLASACISAIPGDTATPIAEKMADFTEYFLLILCVLYAEKYLLAIVGAAAFKILIPCACLALMVGVFWNPRGMRRLSLRLALVALSFVLVIPASIGVSDLVYGSYRQSVETTVQETNRLNDETAPLSEAAGNEGMVASILERLSESASDLAARAAKLLNRYVEALAVLIVTSCIIPLLAMAFFIWLIRLLTGVNVLGAVPPPGFGRRADAERHKAAGE